MHSTQRTGPVTWRMRVSRASASRVMSGRRRWRLRGWLGRGRGGLRARGEEVLRGLHEGAVEGGADVEHDGAFWLRRLAEVGGAVDGGGGSGDDGLVGRVEVGGGDDGEVGVEGFGFGGVGGEG